jgi:hypothetical protein
VRAYTGLTLDEHRALAARLRGIRAELIAVRQLVAAAESSASSEYLQGTKLLRELRTLEHLLQRSAAQQHVDAVPRAQLHALYGDDNPQPEDQT